MSDLSSSASSIPPPLPPRPADGHPSNSNINAASSYMQQQPQFNQYPNTYGHYPYAAGAYGAGGMFNSPYGGYQPMNAGGMYGSMPVPDSNFVRLAEESSRGAFQSIESVVLAVTSVANMLSSTQNAVYSSFRAVIGVVDQFSRLKSQLTQLIFSMWIVRFIQRIWRHLLVLLRLKPKNYASAAELEWTAVNNQMPTGADWLASHGRTASYNWPSMIFWIVAIAGPWIIYRLVSKSVASVEESRKWATGSAEHYAAVALFDFNTTNEHELPFRARQQLRIAPKHLQPQVRGWLLASCDDGQRIGLAPINYVKIVSRKAAITPVSAAAATSSNNLKNVTLPTNVVNVSDNDDELVNKRAHNYERAFQLE